MNDPLAGLPDRDRMGSRARCLLLTHGSADEVAERLTGLSGGRAVVQSGRHAWTPRGPAHPAEAELGKTAPYLSAADREIVSRWWLVARAATARTPNWDLVSQATIAGREGLLLVESKAHAGELRGEEGGKRLKPDASADARANHERIGTCVAAANAALQGETGASWRLSRDACYQMSNRFAWAWKVTELGMPVVLVYLGFLQAREMPEPVPDHATWERQVKSHGLSHGPPVVPNDAWGRTLSVNGTTLTPLIRSLDLPLPLAPAAVA